MADKDDTDVGDKRGTPPPTKSKKVPSSATSVRSLSTSGSKSNAISGSAKDKHSSKKSPSKEKSKSTASRKDIVVTIDLTNPEDLVQKLQTIDFTEEEEEELLQQAYEVNKLLKKELQKHEFESLRQSFARSVTISSKTGKKTSGLMASNLPPMGFQGTANSIAGSATNKDSNQNHSGSNSKLASLAFSKQEGSHSKSSSSRPTSKASSKPKKSGSAAKPGPGPGWNDRWNAS